MLNKFHLACVSLTILLPFRRCCEIKRERKFQHYFILLCFIFFFFCTTGVHSANIRIIWLELYATRKSMIFHQTVAISLSIYLFYVNAAVFFIHDKHDKPHHSMREPMRLTCCAQSIMILWNDSENGCDSSKIIRV